MMIMLEIAIVAIGGVLVGAVCVLALIEARRRQDERDRCRRIRRNRQGTER